jgi:hypothetical protein
MRKISQGSVPVRLKQKSIKQSLAGTKCTCTIAPHDLLNEHENTIAKLAYENDKLIKII